MCSWEPTLSWQSHWPCARLVLESSRPHSTRFVLSLFTAHFGAHVNVRRIRYGTVDHEDVLSSWTSWILLDRIWSRQCEVLCIRKSAVAVLLTRSWSVQHIANLAGNKEIIMPVPAFNVINGGSHAGNKLAMQVRFELQGMQT